VSVVQLLLKDPRVDITLADNKGCTPLWKAAFFGKHQVVEWLVASGRDLGDLNKKGKYLDHQEYTALEVARKEQPRKAAAVLERFLANSMQTRHELRVQLGLLDELAAEFFAFTVFLHEDLLRLKPATSTTESAATATVRFFTMASKLPIELQMILCRCVAGSRNQNILHQDSEAAFKSLARVLQSE